MHLYLPIAGLSVNALVIVLLGCGVGILSGMFGVGGGFLTTPLLIFYGIPPAVAVASSATQITGSSVSGVIAHGRRGGVDYRMGWVLVAGGAVGSVAGAVVFRVLQRMGQIDTIVSILYIVLLGWIGLTMAREAIGSIVANRRGVPAPPVTKRHRRLVAALPFRWRFYGAGLYISPLAPALLGFVAGVLTVLMGVSGGFIVVPALIYLIGASARVVVGTSLFQGLFVAATTTFVQAVTSHAVDIVLAGLLLLGSVTGAQIGARLVQRVRADHARALLAAIVLAIAVRMGLGLGWRPDEIYSLQPLVRRAGLLLLLAPLLIGAADPRLVPDVSDQRIDIVYSFTGAKLLLFGAILYPGGRMPARPPDIAVVIKGPDEPLLLREKAKVAGMWVNRESAGFRSVPSFYAVATSRPIARLLSPRTAAIYEIGIDNLLLSPATSAPPATLVRLERGLIDLKRRGGLYAEHDGAVSIREGVLYRASIPIPARVPVGTYTADTYLITSGRVIAAATRTVKIEKSGFERFVTTMSQARPALYGLAAVLLSLLLGWLAAVTFGRVRR